MHYKLTSDQPILWTRKFPFFKIKAVFSSAHRLIISYAILADCYPKIVIWCHHGYGQTFALTAPTAKLRTHCDTTSTFDKVVSPSSSAHAAAVVIAD